MNLFLVTVFFPIDYERWFQITDFFIIKSENVLISFCTMVLLKKRISLSRIQTYILQFPSSPLCPLSYRNYKEHRTLHYNTSQCKTRNLFIINYEKVHNFLFLCVCDLFFSTTKCFCDRANRAAKRSKKSEKGWFVKKDDMRQKVEKVNLYRPALAKRR